VLTDRYSAHNCRIGPHGRATPDAGRLELPIPARRPGAQIISEYDGRTDEHFIGELDTSVNRHVVLDFYTLADMDTFVHENVLAKRATLTDDSIAA
jgi:hypothetical protein